MPEWKHEVTRRLAGFRLADGRKAEITEEWARYFEYYYQELLACGRSPEEASKMALAELSREALSLALKIGVAGSQESDRGIFRGRRNNMISSLWRDLRYGTRTLFKKPGFTAMAVLTLALGIGATSAIFSVVYATLFEPMPFSNPDQLVIVWSKFEGGRGYVSAGDYVEWKRRSTGFQYLEAASGGAFNISTEDRPEQVQGQIATPGILGMFGYKMTLGRDFLPEEGEPGKEHVVVLTHALWDRRFGANREIIGQQIRMNGEPYTVVGVMPPGQADRLPFQLWVPLTLKPEQINHEGHFLMILGRLKSGVSIDQAQAEMGLIAGQLAEEHPNSNSNLGTSVEPLQNNFLATATRRSLWLLLGAVGFLLLIACVNVANLVLARGTTRRREIAIRAAMGATRAQLFRQFLTESLLLAALGGALGVFLGSILIDAILAIMPPNDSRSPRYSASLWPMRH